MTAWVAGDDQNIWGLISDIHGNLAALDLALRVLGESGANKLAFLGDYLGRGDSDGCVLRIREVADIAVVGNRDLDWQHRVSAASRSYVLALPRTAQAGKLLVSHGDARLTPALSTSQIARGFARVWAEMDERQAQVWAFGHSHYARVWRDGTQIAEAGRVRLDGTARYCVNVGTTGLPFPGKGGPSVALVDFVHAQIRQLPLERI
jgi:predicted phosphodiesterase